MAFVEHVSMIENYRRSHRNHPKYKEYWRKYKDKSVEELTAEYKKAENKELKDWLLTEIYLRIYFLLPYIAKVHHYVMPGHLFDDLLQNGSIAILKAIRRFDPSRGTSLVDYMLGDLQSGISKTFRSNCVVTIPAHCKMSIKEEPEIRKKSPEGEISSYIDSTGTDLENVNDEDTAPPDIATDRIISITQRSNELGMPASTVEYDDEVYKNQRIEMLEEAVNSGILTEDEKMVVVLRNGLFGNRPMVSREIAAMRPPNKRGWSRSRISQIHSKAIGKLKEWFNTN